MAAGVRAAGGPPVGATPPAPPSAIRPHVVAQTVVCHAWNHDNSMLAVSPNTNEIWIYTGCSNPDTAAWTREFVLKEHTMTVAGLDWCGATNRIVSSSHDRSAYVWNFDPVEKVWKPAISVLHISRAALDVKWSPHGKKFACTSGSKCVPVCYYDNSEGNDWWVGKAIKKHRSTVLSVAWHPNSQILATGAADFKCRVFSAYWSRTDGAQDGGPFGEAAEFGTLLASFDASGWVEGVAWAQGGARLAFAAHDSTVTVVDCGEATAIYTVKHKGLPFVALTFVNDAKLLAAGYDMNPAVVLVTDGRWGIDQTLEARSDEKKDTGAAKSGFAASRAMFAQRKTGAGSEAESSDSTPWTTHTGAITGMVPYSRAADGTVTAVSTCGQDGRVVIWKLAELGVR